METLIVVLIFLFFFFAFIIKTFKSSDSSQSSYNSSSSSNHSSTSYSSSTSTNKEYKSPSHNLNKVSVVKFKVAGLFYRSDFCQRRAASLCINEPLLLQAEPDNEVDPNAVKVLTTEGVHIGYMPKDIASQWHSHLDKLNECHLIHNFPDGAIHTLEVGAVFDYISPLTYDYMVDDIWASIGYKEKVPGLSEAKSNWYKDPDGSISLLKSLIETYGDDFYIRYSYLSVLGCLKRYEEAKSCLDQILTDFPISKDSSCIKKEQEYIEDRLRLEKERELRSQINFKLGQAKVFLQEKQYDKALPLLLFCYENDFQRQQLITDICKCYKQTNDKEHLIEFANDALKKEWISPKTAGMLTSLISL